MTKPVRLQLSRRKGFNLQELSRATNGLEAVNVARPSKWGNPFKDYSVSYTPVSQYCRWISQFDPDLRGQFIAPLRGKNLACWCRSSQECHADILLELANPPEPSR